MKVARPVVHRLEMSKQRVDGAQAVESGFFGLS